MRSRCEREEGADRHVRILIKLLTIVFELQITRIFTLNLSRTKSNCRRKSSDAHLSSAMQVNDAM